jgi:hypothetical protein
MCTSIDHIDLSDLREHIEDPPIKLPPVPIYRTVTDNCPSANIIGVPR